MVNMSSNNTKENNRVTISNNQAKYYSDAALGYANQAKIYADSAKLAESNISELLQDENLVSVSQNIEDIKTVAENIGELDSLSTSWGNISGDISNQTDLQTKLNEKANSSDLSTVATSGSYNDLSDKPTIPDVSNLATKTELSVKANTSDLSTVATSGSYNDLSDKPTIPDVSNLATKTELSAKANTSDLSTVATSGSYNDLSNKPNIPQAYTLPTASTTTLGGVKVDGSTITIQNGVISGSATYDDSALIARIVALENKINTMNVTLTINPTPSDATVTLTAQGFSQNGNSITVIKGTEVSYSVSAPDYITKEGTWTSQSSEIKEIELEAPSSTCVPYYANILVDNEGHYKKPAEINVGDMVAAYNMETKQIEQTEVIDIHSPIRDNLVVITFDDDSKIEVTNDHAILTNEGWAAYEPKACHEVENVIELNTSQKILQLDLSYKQIKSIEYVEKLDGIQCYAINTACDTFITETSVVHNCGEGGGEGGWDGGWY